METRIELKQGWKILQDVHDTGEKIGLYAAREADTSVGSQVSEWEELEELKHLQLIYASRINIGLGTPTVVLVFPYMEFQSTEHEIQTSATIFLCVFEFDIFFVQGILYFL
jgi:hypothetical protein